MPESCRRRTIRKGLAGAPIELKIVDEAGNTATVVAEFKNLGQRDKVDAVVGYVSSASCVTLAPVADELQVLTVIYACGTSRLFDTGTYKYVFRVSSSQTSDDVAAARYIVTKFPDTKSFQDQPTIPGDRTIGGISRWR